jgi:hypothetical protein
MSTTGLQRSKSEKQAKTQSLEVEEVDETNEANQLICKSEKYLLTTLKVLIHRADNLNNGGLHSVSASKASVTASSPKLSTF